jgi:HAAS
MHAMNPTDDPMVAEYLSEVERSLHDLPSEAREEILSNIREYILSEMRREAGSRKQVIHVLNELGTPASIAHAANREYANQERQPRYNWWREWVGVLSLPIVWPLGIVLVSTSRIWSRGEKLLAATIFPGGIFLPIGLQGFILYYTGKPCEVRSNADQTGFFCGPASVELYRLGVEAILIAMPILVAVYLLFRLRQRSNR